MLLKTIEDVKTFQNTLAKCEGPVWLESETDYYDLKKPLPQYLGLAKLFDKNNDLEMFASDRDDEARLIHMLATNPGMVA